MIFENLNEDQQKAVRTTEGKVRVIAGAGSGKTRVLAYRYAYLVNELGIDPANILCLTFTNKAAQEMRSRIAKLVSVGHVNDFVCTVHGFCVKFLREEIHRMGYPKNFQILDDEDNIALAKEVLKENGISRKEMTAEELLGSLGIWKKNVAYIPGYLLTSSEYVVEKDNLNLQLLLKQHKYLGLDFLDLILFTLYILEAYEDVCEKWQRKMNYVMVDEVQDCSGLEWDIFRTLSGFHHNLFVVGDPDQSIYEWRGGRIDLFLRFEADKDIVLDRNYRSTSTILDAANSIIANNDMRIKKNLYTLSNPGTKITHFHGKNEQEEADWISDQIIRRRESGDKLSDNAVLIRASYLSRSIEQSFLRHNIGYVIWGGVRFFERQEIKDSLSYLRLIAFDDDVSFKRIANVPSRKIGKVTMETLERIAGERKCSLFSALQYLNDSMDKKKESITQFVELINKYREERQGLTVSDLLNNVLVESGLRNHYRDDTEEERLENLTELLASVKLYEEDHKEDDITLETYLQDVALYTNADYKKEKDQVKIMTIHQAKGLEFPNVFIAGLSEGILPNRRSIRERKKSGMEEERRLMYVAVTRARSNLYLTESEGFLAQQGFNKYPSRFLREIKSNLYVTEGEISEDIWMNADFARHQMDVIIEGRPVADEIEIGSVVVHDHFGEGIVTEVDDDGQYCTVDFPDIGPRTLNRVKLSLRMDEERVPDEAGDEGVSDSRSLPSGETSPDDMTAGWKEAIMDDRISPFMRKYLMDNSALDVKDGHKRVIVCVDNELQRSYIQNNILPVLERKALSEDGINEIVVVKGK